MNVDRVRLIKDLVGGCHCNRIADVEHVVFAESMGRCCYQFCFGCGRDFFQT